VSKLCGSHRALPHFFLSPRPPTSECCSCLGNVVGRSHRIRPGLGPLFHARTPDVSLERFEHLSSSFPLQFFLFLLPFLFFRAFLHINWSPLRVNWEQEVGLHSLVSSALRDLWIRTLLLVSPAPFLSFSDHRRSPGMLCGDIKVFPLHCPRRPQSRRPIHSIFLQTPLHPLFSMFFESKGVASQKLLVVVYLSSLPLSPLLVR